ncbi:MAG: glycerophosphodiester phosphodiesterase family protein [Bacillus sp. (in: firmicutes)]
MAEYTDNLNLFEPGSDDNIGIESSLKDNFDKIDSKLGDGLKDASGQVHTSLGTRLNSEQTDYETTKSIVTDLSQKEYNVIKDDFTNQTLANRGNVLVAPENTMAAFQHALEAGYWGIKTDLRKSSDNKWVLITDETVDRTSNGFGAVSGKNLTQLKALDFGNKFDSFYTDEKIPTLEEFLWFCRKNNIVAYIELRIDITNGEASELATIIDNYFMTNRTCIISNNSTNLTKFRAYSQLLPLGLATGTVTQTYVNYAKDIKNCLLFVRASDLTIDSVKLATAAKISVDAWYAYSYDDVETAFKNGARRVASSNVNY